MSSTETTEIDAPTGADQVVNDAVSTDGEDVSGGTIYDAVDAALNVETPAPSADEPGQQPGQDQNAITTPKGGDATQEDKDKDGDLPELTEAEIAAQTPGAQRRIRDLIAGRKELESQLEASKEDATYGATIRQAMANGNIEPAELDNALAITSLIKQGRAQDALNALQPMIAELQRQTGAVLPDDLVQDVKLGRISQQRALELSRARAQAASATQARDRIEAAQRETAMQQQHQQVVHDAAMAADDWAKSKAASDPDWHAKQDLVTEAVELELLRQGADKFPRTKEEVIALNEAALKRVNERLKSVLPAPKPVKPPVAGTVRPRTAEPPKNMIDVVNRAVGL